VSCRQPPLKLPANGPFQPMAIDPTGRYILGDRVHVPAGASPPFVWTDGVPVDLSVPFDSDVFAVGSTGAVIGRTGGQGWIYRVGKRTVLTAPDGGPVLMASVNARGDAAGLSFTGAGSGRNESTLVVWRAGRYDRPETFPSVTAQREGVFLADDGTVVTTATDKEGGTLPRQFRADGSAVELPVPPGSASAGPTALNGRWAVGSSLAGSGAPRLAPMRWNLDTGGVETLDTGPTDPAGLQPEPVAVGPDGRVLVRVGNDLRLVPGPAGGAVRPVELSVPPGALPVFAVTPTEVVAAWQATELEGKPTETQGRPVLVTCAG
jgi:hypothetical protein